MNLGVFYIYTLKTKGFLGVPLQEPLNNPFFNSIYFSYHLRNPKNIHDTILGLMIVFIDKIYVFVFTHFI